MSVVKVFKAQSRMITHLADFDCGNEPYELHDISVEIFKKIVEFCDFMIEQNINVKDATDIESVVTQNWPKVVQWFNNIDVNDSFAILDACNYLEFRFLMDCACKFFADNYLNTLLDDSALIQKRKVVQNAFVVVIYPRHEVQNTIVDICIALEQLNLPNYVLLFIMELIPKVVASDLTNLTTLRTIEKVTNSIKNLNVL